MTENKIDYSKLTISQADAAKYTFSKPPSNIIFYDTSTENQREVMRITKDGVTSNPDVPVDEGAKAIIRALDGYIKNLVKESLAKQEQGEPVAWRAPNWGHSADDYVYRDFDDPVIGADGKPSPNNEPLYTKPQQRKPLTDEQLKPFYQNQEWLDGVRFAEAAHGIKE